MTSSLVALLYIGKIGAKVLHGQSRAVCSGFSYLDGSADGLHEYAPNGHRLKLIHCMVTKILRHEEGVVDLSGKISVKGAQWVPRWRPWDTDSPHG